MCEGCTSALPQEEGTPPLHSWTSLGGYYHPPNGNAAKRRSRSPQKDSPIEQEVRRQFNLPSAPEDAGSLFYSQPIPLGQEPGESKGVLPLVPGVQGPGGPW